MNNHKIDTILGLPRTALNILSGGISSFLICLGASLWDSSEIALEVANTRLVTSGSADKLESLATQLDKQAELIKQKDIAYDQLKTTYQGYLANKKGGIELDEAFEVIEKLPKVESTEEIQQEISEVEKDLSEIVIE